MQGDTGLECWLTKEEGRGTAVVVGGSPIRLDDIADAADVQAEVMVQLACSTKLLSDDNGEVGSDSVAPISIVFGIFVWRAIVH